MNIATRFCTLLCLFVTLAFAIAAPEALASVEPQVVPTMYACDDYVIASVIATQPPFGAKPDGATNCTAAVQGAIDAVAEAGGGVVYLPAGRYRFEGSLILRDGVSLRGDWKAPNIATGDLKVAGTILEPTAGRGAPDGSPFIAIEDSSCVRNLSIWYPDQTTDDIAPYPWTIATGSTHGVDNFTVKNVTFVNSYSAIRLGGKSGIEPTLVQNIYGTAVSTGILLDGASDTPHMALLHFGPQYWLGSGLGSRPDAPKLKKYLLAGAVGLDIARADGLDVYRAAIDGYSVGVLSRHTKMGTPYGGIFGLNTTNCHVGLMIEDLSWLWQLTCCTFDGASAGIWAKEGFRSLLQLNGCRLIAPQGDALRSDGMGSVQAQNCTIDGRVIMNGQGSLTMLASTLKGSSRVVIGPHVTRALLIGGIPKADVSSMSMGDIQIDPRPLSSIIPRNPPGEWFPDRRPATPLMLNVADFGASSAGLAEYGNGKPNTYSAGDIDFRSKYTDNTISFQKALDRAGAAGGGTVYVPAGIYYFAGCLKVPTGVELRGTADGPHLAHQRGVYLLATSGRGQEGGTPFISLAPNSGARGFSIIYPDQKVDAITPYPWTFRALGPKCWLMDITVSNPYQLADFGSFPSDGHLIRAVQGTPLRRGLWVSKGSGEVDTCDFNPSWLLGLYNGAPSVWSTQPVTRREASDVLCAYLKQHQDAFVFGSCPQTLQINNGVFLTGNGLRFVADNGGASGGWVINHESDTAPCPMNVEASSHAGLDVDNIVLFASEEQFASLRVSDSSHGSLQLFNGFAGTLNLAGRGATTVQNWTINRSAQLPTARVSGGSVALQSVICGPAELNIAAQWPVKRLELDGVSSMGGELACSPSKFVVARGSGRQLPLIPLKDSFITGFEPGQMQPTPRLAVPLELTSSDCKVAPSVGRGGGAGLLLTVSPHTSVKHAAAVYEIFKCDGVTVKPDTLLRFWMRPENEIARNCVIDLNFSDGSELRDHVPTSEGASMHPLVARGRVGQWSRVDCWIGGFAAGRTVKSIVAIFDSGKPTGDCRCAFDDIEIGEPANAVGQ